MARPLIPSPSLKGSFSRGSVETPLSPLFLTFLLPLSPKRAFPWLSLRGCQTSSMSPRSGRAQAVLAWHTLAFTLLSSFSVWKVPTMLCNHVMRRELCSTQEGQQAPHSWRASLWHWPCNGSLEFPSTSLNYFGSEFIDIHVYFNLKRKQIWGHIPLTVSNTCYSKLGQPDLYLIWLPIAVSKWMSGWEKPSEGRCLQALLRHVFCCGPASSISYCSPCATAA